MAVQGAGQGDDIDSWMAQRRQEIADRDQNFDAGREAWAASTATGENLSAQNLSAQNSDDLRALGASAQAQDVAAKAAAPISRGDKSVLSDEEKTGILFNEFRSYSGPQAQRATINGAHALINADESRGVKRPVTASAAAHVPPAEAAKYKEVQDALAAAKAERAQGIDPTNGALHFNFRTDNSRAPREGWPIRTQIGPLHNSYTGGDVPSAAAYANTYKDD